MSIASLVSGGKVMEIETQTLAAVLCVFSPSLLGRFYHVLGW